MSTRHPNLAGWWRFESSLADSSGAGNTGSMGAGTATYDAGKMGRAYVNAANRYVDFGNAASLQITGALTISAWVYRTGGDAAIAGGIAGKYSTGDSQRGYVLWASAADTSHVLQLALSSAGTAGTVFGSSVAVPLNTWQHVCAVYVPSTRVRLYQDLVLTGDHATTLASLHNSTQSLVTTWFTTGDNDRRMFIGRIDELMIFNAALDANDIRRVRLGLMPLRRYT
jgi:hypothetical protein